MIHLQTYFPYVSQSIESSFPTTSFTGLSHSGPYPPAQIHLGSRTRQLEKAPTPQSPPKLFKPANPMSGYSASSVTSHGNHNKGPCSCPGLTFCPLSNSIASHMALHGVAWLLLLGTVAHTPSFQRQSSDWLVSPYPNNNKIYTF